jgi:hypothetical protein
MRGDFTAAARAHQTTIVNQYDNDTAAGSGSSRGSSRDSERHKRCCNAQLWWQWW